MARGSRIPASGLPPVEQRPGIRREIDETDPRTGSSLAELRDRLEQRLDGMQHRQPRTRLTGPRSPGVTHDAGQCVLHGREVFGAQQRIETALEAGDDLDTGSDAGSAAIGEGHQLLLVVAELIYPVSPDVGDQIFYVAPLLSAIGMISAGIAVLSRSCAGCCSASPCSPRSRYPPVAAAPRPG